MAKYNEKGEEIPDSVPVEIPLRFRTPLPLNEEIKRLIREEMSQAAADQGEETFQEADDFEVEEGDPLPFSAHELSEMQEEAVLPRDGSDLERSEDPEPTPAPSVQPGAPDAAKKPADVAEQKNEKSVDK